MRRRCGVLGKPISHSLSPAMHRAAYAHLGLDWTYDAFEVGEPELEAFLRGCDESWRGLSLTMPLKRVVIDLADEIDTVAAALGVANTIVFGEHGIAAGNTDCAGAVAALAEKGIDSAMSVRILGGGATATSIAYAVATAGARHIEFVVRNPETVTDAVAVAENAGAEVLVRGIDQPLIRVVDLLVSTIPAEAVRAGALGFVESSRAVFDVIYDPWPTPLAAAAVVAGIPLVSGLDLLAHQATLQVQMMTGSPVSVDILRDAALAELSCR